MKSYEAIQTAIDGKTVEHAKRQRKSPSLLHKWQEPATDFTDSGTINPLDRVEGIVEAALSLGTTREKALAPLRYLSERFGVICIPIPESNRSLDHISKELMKTIKEFGELMKTTSDSLADGKINKREFKQVKKDAWESVRQIIGLLTAIEGEMQ